MTPPRISSVAGLPEFLCRVPGQHARPASAGHLKPMFALANLALGTLDYCTGDVSLSF